MRRIAAVATFVSAIAIVVHLQALPQSQELDAMRAADAPPNAIWLDSLDLTKMVQRRGTPRAGRYGGGGGRGNATPPPITLGGQTYVHGIGTPSINELIVDLKGQATRFVSMIGIDDAAAKGQGSVNVEVWVDNVKKFDSGFMKGGDAPKFVSVDVTNAKFLELFVDDGGDVSTGDYADWGGALIYLEPGATTKPESWTFPSDPAPPIASGDPAEPRVNAPFITGGTPGHDFLFRIPATGEAPLRFAAADLPAGLKMDSATGIITGAIAKAGRYRVPVTVTNAHGRATSILTIVGGDDGPFDSAQGAPSESRGALALTPPLGWNSWNVWGTTVDDAKIRAAADAMVSSGLAAHGFAYINIDDGWEGQRDANGVLQPNEKFPNMKALADYVHSKGLKIGIYSSPGPRTCGGFAGSLGYEELDAKTWAEWGFDVLKHDWCSYGNTLPGQPLADLQKPYLVMRDALKKTNRDFIYSLCQYGMGNVWEWGKSVGGHYWRTTGDLTDVWSNMSAVGFRQANREQYSKPGGWTDPDMLVIGKVGWGPQIHDTRLTPNEQLVHISLWSLQAAPLLIGADMAQFDKWTTDLMTNHEVLAIQQDMLGRGATRVYQRERLELWARPLADGTMAIGLFNRGLQPAKMTATWKEIGLTGSQTVRDVWLHKDLGAFAAEFSDTVPAHGVVMVKIGQPKQLPK
ncbi:MAG TPA: NPCBM/NEW2 domain-containing protein [Vicinamibacterales bacterium]|nr:NPCBM/NEW2 domain-containing protein [Vicinamibacterales bacterium]